MDNGELSKSRWPKSDTCSIDSKRSIRRFLLTLCCDITQLFKLANIEQRLSFSASFDESTISAGFQRSNSSSRLLNLSLSDQVAAQDSPVDESITAMLSADFAKTIELNTDLSFVANNDSS